LTYIVSHKLILYTILALILFGIVACHTILSNQLGYCASPWEHQGPSGPSIQPGISKDPALLERLIEALEIEPCASREIEGDYLLILQCWRIVPVGILVYVLKWVRTNINTPPQKSVRPFSLYLLNKRDIFILVWGDPCPPIEEKIAKQKLLKGPIRCQLQNFPPLLFSPPGAGRLTRPPPPLL